MSRVRFKFRVRFFLRFRVRAVFKVMVRDWVSSGLFSSLCYLIIVRIRMSAMFTLSACFIGVLCKFTALHRITVV